MRFQEVPPVFAVALFTMVIVWFVLTKMLFNRLERAHPAKYEAMGKPSLFLRNNIATGWATLKFIVCREHSSLNDSYLSKLSDAMLVYFSIYLLFFLGISAWIANSPMPAA
jgi:hypothetical protein